MSPSPPRRNHTSGGACTRPAIVFSDSQDLSSWRAEAGKHGLKVRGRSTTSRYDSFTPDEPAPQKLLHVVACSFSQGTAAADFPLLSSVLSRPEPGMGGGKETGRDGRRTPAWGMAPVAEVGLSQSHNTNQTCLPPAAECRAAAVEAGSLSLIHCSVRLNSGGAMSGLLFFLIKTCFAVGMSPTV
jgi:hypothetical protein